MPVIFPENIQVPFIGRHQAIREAGDVLACPLADGLLLLLLGQKRSVVAAEEIHHMIESDCLPVVDPIVQRQRAVPVVIVGPAVLA